MKKASEHVSFQIPNKFTRVGHRVAGHDDQHKSNADPTLETSKRHHFELAANYLQPFYLVLKKIPSGTKCDAIKISDVSVSGFGTKPSVSKTGVSL
eukprot:566901-Ditylum_brightwellii.AAC.1